MKLKIVILVFMLATALLLVIATGSIKRSVKIKKLGVTAESTVINSVRGSSKGGSSRTVTVSFSTPDNSQVTGTATTRKVIFKGDRVMIWYDPASPQKIDFGDTIKYNLKGAIICVILLFFGLYYFVRLSIRDAANKKLIRAGQKITADFVSVDRNERYNMGDNNPWVIKCKWTDSINNKEYYFVSRDYTIDPAPYLAGRYHLDVFINPADPGRYYMDTSFMPKGNNTIG